MTAFCREDGSGPGLKPVVVQLVSCATLVVGGTEPGIEEVKRHANNPRGRSGWRGPTGRAAVALPSPCRRQQMTNYTLIENGMPVREISESFVQTVHTAGIGAGVFLGLLWSVKGDKAAPTEHYITPVRTHGVLEDPAW